MTLQETKSSSGSFDEPLRQNCNQVNRTWVWRRTGHASQDLYHITYVVDFSRRYVCRQLWWCLHPPSTKSPISNNKFSMNLSIELRTAGHKA